MDRTEAMAWVLSLCIGLVRRSQAKTLAHLVGAALATPRLSLAGIGRELARHQEGAAKHAIKRVWRFVANRRVEPVEVMPALMNRLWQRKLKWHRKRPEARPLLVSLDWTKVRQFHVLLAAVVVEGRALPLCWESYKSQVQGKSQNALEYAMLLKIQAALPAGLQVVILADRGFGRAALAQECQKLGLGYLVRICPDVVVKTARWQGNLKHYPIRKGACHGWSAVEYRSDGAVQTHLIARWKKGLAASKDEPWHLITSLDLRGRGRAAQVSDLYAQRFDIEELFRDTKNEHLGWSLAKTRIRRADRLDRLILIAALAYVLLVALGLWCRAHRPARLWASNNRLKELSAFAIGKVMLDRVRLKIRSLVPRLLSLLATTEGNWG